MLTRIYFLGFWAICLGSVQVFAIFHSFNSQDSCPALANRGELLSPSHKIFYNIHQHTEQENRKLANPNRSFKPVQWLMHIIRIRTIVKEQPKPQLQKTSVVHRHVLLHRLHDSQSPTHIRKQAKMLLILKHNPRLEHQPNHFIM